MNPEISFFTENIKYTIKNKMKIRRWINEMVMEEGKTVGDLTIIICDDNYLAMLSTTYLKKNHFTDVMAFDSSESEEILSGDIFISIERVRENSNVYKKSITNELYRVLSHGILHLLGYRDKNEKQKSIMTSKEDEYINKIAF